MNFTHKRPRRWPLTIVAALALLTIGCSKSGASAAYPDAAYAGAELPPATTVDITGATAGYRGGEYDFAEDLASGDDGAAMAERSVISSPAHTRTEFRADAPPARDAKGKANEEAKKQTAAKNAEPEAAVAKDDEPDHGRQIIYTAGMQLSVYALETGMSAVEHIPDKYGGWVHQRTQNQIVLRLPALNLKPVMAELAKLGVVEARTLQAQDVTAEYVDLDSRIKVLRETQAQLLELLAKAKTVEEALHVRTALDNVTMELEVALGRMRQLSDLIAFSTLTVTLIERGPQDSIPTSNDPFRWVDSLGVEATEWR